MYLHPDEIYSSELTERGHRSGLSNQNCPHTLIEGVNPLTLSKVSVPSTLFITTSTEAYLLALHMLPQHRESVFSPRLPLSRTFSPVGPSSFQDRQHNRLQWESVDQRDEVWWMWAHFLLLAPEADVETKSPVLDFFVGSMQTGHTPHHHNSCCAPESTTGKRIRMDPCYQDLLFTLVLAC